MAGIPSMFVWSGAHDIISRLTHYLHMVPPHPRELSGFFSLIPPHLEVAPGAASGERAAPPIDEHGCACSRLQQFQVMDKSRIAQHPLLLEWRPGGSIAKKQLMPVLSQLQP